MPGSSVPHELRASLTRDPQPRQNRPALAQRSRTCIVLVHRGAMRTRQECVHGVAARIEDDRVRAALRRDALDPAHRLRIEYLDDAGIANRDVEMPERGV